MTLTREWVTVTDPDDDHLRYTFDVSFLLSGYTCIYGAGCPGIREDGEVDEVVGCCTHGAYVEDDDEAAELERLVAEELDETTMQHHAEASESLLEDDEEGEVRTRMVDGACIFLNGAGFEAGTGCALHHLAARRGEHHMTHKPTVCWQVPLHRTIEEVTGNDGQPVEVHTIAAFERGHWGDGGADFGWWCTEEPAAFGSRTPLYRSMEHELRAMVGDDVYDELATHLTTRRQRHRVRFLPIV